ncbi:hypothetical protein JCM18899A_46710 [Nocardioides sp. AN3]
MTTTLGIDHGDVVVEGHCKTGGRAHWRAGLSADGDGEGMRPAGHEGQVDGRHRAGHEDIERQAVAALEALSARARQGEQPEPVLLEHVEQQVIAGGMFRRARREETRTKVGHGWMIAELVPDSSGDEDGHQGHRLEVYLLDDGLYAAREAGTTTIQGPFVECPGWASGVDFWIQVRDRCMAAVSEPHRHRKDTPCRDGRG